MSEETPKTRQITRFMCNCESNPDGQAECKEIYEKALAYMGRTPPKPEMFLTDVVMSLAHTLKNLHGEITSLAADMWCGVGVKLYHPCSSREYANIWVECDLIEHGLAKALLLAVELSEAYEVPEPEPPATLHSQESQESPSPASA